MRGHSRIGNVGVLRLRLPSLLLGDFGPTDGRDAVVAAAGPRPAGTRPTAPGGAVAFTSRADLVTKLAANPSGTHFVAANSMVWDAQVNTDGAKVTDIWFPIGTVLDAQGANITGMWVNANASIHGGEWKNFGTGSNDAGALYLRGGPPPYSGPVLLEDAIIHHCTGAGFGTASHNSTIRYCRSYSNGRYGWNATEPESGAPLRTNVRIERSEWYDNNTRHLAMGGDAGGNKVTSHSAFYCGFNYAHDNYGVGIWTDYSPNQHVIEENVVETNRAWGIFYEVGDGAGVGLANAIIRRNYMKDNAFAGTDDSWFNAVQILASCSNGLSNGGTGFEVYRNLIDGYFRAIGFVDHDVHPADSKGMHCHDNDVWLRGTATGRVGGFKGGTFDPFTAAANNTFENNHYHVPDLTAAKWYWSNADKTWAQWQALGHDDGGTLEVI